MINKQNLFNSAKKIKRDIYLYPFLIVFLSITSITYIIFHSIDNFKNSETSELKSKLLKKEKELSIGQTKQVIKLIDFHQEKTMKILKGNLKKRIYEASNIIDSIIKENKNKSKKELKQLVSSALSPIRFFNGRGYYLVYDKDTKKSVIHPVKRFVGKDMSNFKDKKGQVIVQLFDNIIKENGEGFTPDIYFVKPGTKDKKEYKKYIFVKYIPELNWVIGTGDYFDEVEKEIQNNLLTQLENIRYGENGYFWIMDSEHKLLMHPFRKSEIGTDQKNVQDSKGTFIGRVAVKEAIKNPSGTFIKYYWIKPNKKNEVEKLNYIRYVKQWDWIIGTGVYLDDISTLVKSQQSVYENKIKELYKNIFILFLILLFITLFIVFNLSKKIKKAFDKYSNKLQNINEDLESKVNKRTSELNKLNNELETRISLEVEKNRYQEIQLLEQSKLAQMGEMIGNIAHQWRQPLSIISMLASSRKLQIDLKVNNETENIKDLNTILDTTQHLSKTIDQFRDFIKTDRELKEEEVYKIIDNVISLLEASLKHHNISLDNEFDKSNNLKIKTVDGELTQVLINIINNAKDALTKNKVEKPYIKVTSKEDKDSISIFIEDNAGGIDKKIFNKIFNPYFTTKHQSQGTGIGLYICKKIIENNLKGELFAQNTDIGAKFVIKLPKDKELN